MRVYVLMNNLPILITWGIPQEHWIQTRHATTDVQYSQIALRGDSQVFRMVVKSWDPLFFQNSRDDSELLIKTEFDGAYADFGVCVKFAIIILGATFSSLFYLPSCYSQVWARLGLDVAPPSPSQADRWYTCERRLLHLACRSLCIPSFRRSDLSTDKYHGNSRAWLPAPLWRRRTAPAEL